MKYTALILILFQILFPPLIRSQEIKQLPVDSSQSILYFRNTGDSFKFNYPDSAQYYYQKALILARGQNNISEEADVLSKIGGAYYILGDYFQSLSNFSEALEIWSALEDQRGIAAGLNNIGLILTVQEKYDLAIDHHRRSISICRQVHDTLLEERNLFNLGITYSAKKNYDSALYYTQMAQQLCDQINYPREKMRLYNSLGEIYYEKGEYHNSTDAYFEVLKNKTYNNKWERCYALSGIARTSLKLGYPHQAIKYALMSDTLAQEMNTLWDLRRIAETLSEAYFSLGNYKHAYTHHLAFKTYSDSLFNKEKEREMNHLHLLQTALENQNLLHLSELQKEELRRKSQLSYIYILGFLLFLVLAILLWRILWIKLNMNKTLKAKNSIIAHKNKELERVNATKDRFFHMVAHDLKSPLSVMISFTDILQQNFASFNEAQIREFLIALHQSSSQGFRLLENLLDWARLQTDAITYQPARLKLLPLVNDTTTLLESNAMEKNISIKTEIDQNLMANIDRNMFLTVMRNLISNAIKFTNPGGTITIKTEKHNNALKIHVMDTGVGIPEKEMASLFNIENYYTRPGTNHEKGTGIGLILCHDFVKKMGGQIFVTSKEGQGSCFTFTVPL